MPLLFWDDKYLIGIKHLDDDHRLLVKILNELCGLYVSHRFKDGKVEAMLDSLFTYSVEHFASEENWMREANFPGLEIHTLDHGRFVSRLSEFSRKVKHEGGVLTLDMISFLRVWLVSHILQTDSALGEFSRESMALVPESGRL
jgi:hemerythrin